MSHYFPREINQGDTEGAMRDVQGFDRKLTQFLPDRVDSWRYQEIARERDDTVEFILAWRADPELGDPSLPLHFPPRPGAR